MKDQVFSVDSTMQGLFNLESYKREMWRLLKSDEPEFMSSIRYDTLVVRVCDWDETERAITVQPALYSDQVVTNHQQTLGKRVPGDSRKRVVEDLAYDKAGRLLGFNQSPLSNTVGIACVIQLEERYWVAALRSKTVAFDPGMLGCSASGALMWTEIGF